MSANLQNRVILSSLHACCGHYCIILNYNCGGVKISQSCFNVGQFRWSRSSTLTFLWRGSQVDEAPASFTCNAHKQHIWNHSYHNTGLCKINMKWEKNKSCDFFLQLFDIPASRRRRANTIMNKRRTCRQRSFAAASCCLGKARLTSAATHAGASHFVFFFFFAAAPRARRRTASADLSARGGTCLESVSDQRGETGKSKETPDTLHCAGGRGRGGAGPCHWICCSVPSSLIRWEKLWRQLFWGKTHQGACCITLIKWSRPGWKTPTPPPPTHHPIAPHGPLDEARRRVALCSNRSVHGLCDKSVRSGSPLTWAFKWLPPAASCAICTACSHSSDLWCARWGDFQWKINKWRNENRSRWLSCPAWACTRDRTTQLSRNNYAQCQYSRPITLKYTALISTGSLSDLDSSDQ